MCPRSTVSPASLTLRRRSLLAGAAASSCLPAWAQAVQNPGPKVLRYALPVAETGFDPAQVSDLYSRTILAGIFETPLAFDYLARPFRLKPATAAALPEISDSYRSFVLRLKPGIYFADDSAFKGRRRELTAADHVYSLKRHYDPRWKSPNLYRLEGAGILGLSELRRDVLKSGAPFPYEREVEGLQTLDRYTFRVRLAEPSPRFADSVMTDAGAYGAVAREVVEAYGGRLMEHPVGTGPFRLGTWRRSSFIVLERNPGYRGDRYDEQPPADDARSQAIAAQLRGRRLPMVDRVEFSVIEESQPRWLAFLNRELDFMDRLPGEYAPIAIPNDTLAPHLAKQGITMDRFPLVDVTMAAVFNLEHPLLGGYTPQKVALRRALGLAYDVQQEIALVRNGQAIPAQGPIAPTVFGYDPTFHTEMSETDVARANALLDLYGYADRNGDGWREQPDGSPLLLEYATQPDQLSRQLSELWDKAARALRLHLMFKVAKWPENLKASQAGRLMIWGVAWSAASPDGDTFLALGYGPNKGGANHSRFDLPAFNELYRRQRVLPDGPERSALMREASKLMVAYMPYKFSGHRIATDLMHPWVIGYRRNPFVRDFFKYVDIDAALQARGRP